MEPGLLGVGWTPPYAWGVVNDLLYLCAQFCFTYETVFFSQPMSLLVLSPPILSPNPPGGSK